jgi:ApaG protein
MDGKLKQPMFSEVVSSRTEDVMVSVQTAYLPTQSNPSTDQYMFAYRIRITNESAQTVQLLRRMWIITDAYGRRRKVEGEGVVGQQPILAPGETHEYMSGCDFVSPVGQMRGYFYMVRKGQAGEFKVRIPTFTMATPSTLN